MRVVILQLYGNHLHDRIIPIRGRIWPLKLLVVYPRHFLLKCPYASTLRGHVLVCLGYRCCLFFLLDFGNDPMMSYLLFFHIIAKVNPIYKFVSYLDISYMIYDFTLNNYMCICKFYKVILFLSRH